MKLQPDHRPTPYLNRRDQYRLLTLLGLLCVMMVAIKWAAQPSSWHWLVPPERQSAGDIPELKEIDFRVKAQDQSALPPDAFRIVELNEQGEDGPEGSEAPSTEVDVPADCTVTFRHWCVHWQRPTPEHILATCVATPDGRPPILTEHVGLP